MREGGRNKKQETDEEKTWLVLHKESKQAQKMQHPEKLNQEAKDKASPGQCDPDNNNDNNNSKIHRRIHNGEEKKAKEEFTKEKEERMCTTTAQSQKKEKDIASKFTIHEKKNPPHLKKNRKNPKPKETQNKKKKKTKNQKKLKTKNMLEEMVSENQIGVKITDTIHYNTFASKTVLVITSSELIYSNIIIMHLRVIRGQTSVCCKFVA